MCVAQGTVGYARPILTGHTLRTGSAWVATLIGPAFLSVAGAFHAFALDTGLAFIAGTANAITAIVPALLAVALRRAIGTGHLCRTRGVSTIIVTIVVTKMWVPSTFCVPGI